MTPGYVFMGLVSPSFLVERDDQHFHQLCYFELILGHGIFAACD